MTVKPDFNQTVQCQWSFWGQQFNFAFPAPAEGVQEMPASISQAPGQEPWGFYETIFDLESGHHYCSAFHPALGEDIASPEQIEQLQNAGKALFTRRRFNHCWFVSYSGHESFWFDIWVNRVEEGKNLLDPRELQTAHLKYLSLYWLKQDEEMRGFNDEAPVYHALDWRWQKVNNHWLQTYSEVNDDSEERSYISGQCFLLPLGPRHYIWLRFYRMDASNYKEAADDFQQLVNFVIQHFSFSLSPETHAALQSSGKTSLQPVDFSASLSTNLLKKWKRLDRELKEKTFLSSAAEATPPARLDDEEAPNSWASLLYAYAPLVILLMIFVPACIKGFIFLWEWQSQNPGSPWNWLINIYFGFCLIISFREPIRKWASS